VIRNTKAGFHGKFQRRQSSKQLDMDEKLFVAVKRVMDATTNYMNMLGALTDHEKISLLVDLKSNLDEIKGSANELEIAAKMLTPSDGGNGMHIVISAPSQPINPPSPPTFDVGNPVLLAYIVVVAVQLICKRRLSQAHEQEGD